MLRISFCRGPVWINVNYLALGALRHYSVVPGPAQERCGEIYTQLRENVMRMVISEYERTGYFWEQYDERTGRGMRNHPFTGWTATALLIMAELY